MEPAIEHFLEAARGFAKALSDDASWTPPEGEPEMYYLTRDQALDDLENTFIEAYRGLPDVG